jgi:hypothetical protein
MQHSLEQQQLATTPAPQQHLYLLLHLLTQVQQQHTPRVRGSSGAGRLAQAGQHRATILAAILRHWVLVQSGQRLGSSGIKMRRMKMRISILRRSGCSSVLQHTQQRQQLGIVVLLRTVQGGVGVGAIASSGPRQQRGMQWQQRRGMHMVRSSSNSRGSIIIRWHTRRRISSSSRGTISISTPRWRSSTSTSTLPWLLPMLLQTQPVLLQQQQRQRTAAQQQQRRASHSCQQRTLLLPSRA